MSDTRVIATLAVSIRKHRLAAGLTQHQVAEALEITDSNVSQYENARYAPNLERLRQMAEIFGCSVADLVEGL